MRTLRINVGAGGSDDDAAGASYDLERARSNAEIGFYHDKVQAAIFYAFRVLPEVGAAAVAIRAGETAAMDAVLAERG